MVLGSISFENDAFTAFVEFPVQGRKAHNVMMEPLVTAGWKVLWKRSRESGVVFVLGRDEAGIVLNFVSQKGTIQLHVFYNPTMDLELFAEIGEPPFVLKAPEGAHFLDTSGSESPEGQISGPKW